MIATLLSPSTTRSGLLYTPSTMSLEHDLNRPAATSEPGSGSDTSPAVPTVTMTEPSERPLEHDLNRPAATSEPGSGRDTSPAVPTVTMTEPSERLSSNLPLNTNHHRNHGAGSSTSEPATSVMTNQLGNSNANSYAPSILSPPKM